MHVIGILGIKVVGFKLRLLNPWHNNPTMHGTGGCGRPTTGLDAVDSRKITVPAWIILK
jgi:hypothetical protein